VLGATQLEEALAAVGELLADANEHVAIVVVGGASLTLLGLIERTTGDVDVIARMEPFDGEPFEDNRSEEGTGPVLVRPEPMPQSLEEAAQTVARDFGLPGDWMNAVIGAQWDLGLPPSLKNDLTWRTYSGLSVGLVGRSTLITLKLFAAVDQGPESIHIQDLVALHPTDEELADAARWVSAQDASPQFTQMTQEVVDHVTRHRT
jgi:hypothetical protein